MVLLVDSGYEITQLRNSFIASIGATSDFRWTPEEMPEGFLRDTRPPPAEFQESVSKVLASLSSDATTTEHGLALARHLASGPGAGGGIQSNTRDAYHTILFDGKGYCSDYTQVLNGLAYAAGIPVREWGMSFDNYSGDGHAFNEIYDAGLDDWVLVDSFYSLYFVDAQSARPLSALELRERLAAGDGSESIEVRAIVPERFGFKSPDMAIEYYRRGTDEFFLYYGNNVFSYDAHPVVSVLGRFSRALEESAGILLGIRPGIRLVTTKTNGASIDALFLRRRFFLLLTLLAVCLAVGLAFQFRSLRRHRRSETA
jgi:hypothetical protein